MRKPVPVIIVCGLVILSYTYSAGLEECVVEAGTPAAPGISIVVIETQPAGVNITVEDLYTGTAPVELRTLPRPLRITAEMAGFNRADFTIVPGDGERAGFLLRLSPRSPGSSFNARSFFTAMGISGGVVLTVGLLLAFNVIK